MSSVRYEVAADGVATLTLDRPERLNAFDLAMIDEVHAVWRELRYDDAVRAVVVTGAGDRAFCTGIDRGVRVPQPGSPYMVEDPAVRLGPKAADLWKPVVAAVNGMACGGAFYLLGECEFAIAAEHATFFDPHTAYGMVSAFEVLRMALMGTAERIGARRAHEIGLVSEVVPAGELAAAAHRCAAVIASYPPEAVQGTVRAAWTAREMTRAQALAMAPHLVSLGSAPADRQADLFAARSREYRVR